MTRIDIDSPAVAYGLGLFETILIDGGRAVLLEEHFERMRHSAHALGFPPPDEGAFAAIVANAIAISPGELAVRCVYVAEANDRWTLAATANPIPALTLSRRARGRVVRLEPSLSRGLPEHKMTSYAPCVIGLRQAVAADADEGLFVTTDGLILEGTATNVFAVRDRTLITAPAGVLPGIMRAWVLREAAVLGLSLEQRCPSADDLRAGSFLTGSLTLLAPIREVDGVPCAPPGTAFDELVERWRLRPR